MESWPEPALQFHFFDRFADKAKRDPHCQSGEQEQDEHRDELVPRMINLDHWGEDAEKVGRNKVAQKNRYHRCYLPRQPFPHAKKNGSAENQQYQDVVHGHEDCSLVKFGEYSWSQDRPVEQSRGPESQVRR